VLLTAGHCEKMRPGEYIHFNTPLSNPVGIPQPAALKDQYAISFPLFRVSNDDDNNPDPTDPHPMAGNDWAIFFVEPNTETGLTPAQAQGDSFHLRRDPLFGEGRVTGYRLDDHPQTANQAQQTAQGQISRNIPNGSEDVLVEHFC
jgi:hypothetical protein